MRSPPWSKTSTALLLHFHSMPLPHHQCLQPSPPGGTGLSQPLLLPPQVEELINGMFSSSGINHKESLTYDDFKLMMREYKGDFIAIGLDCKGAKQNFLDTSTNVAR